MAVNPSYAERGRESRWPSSKVAGLIWKEAEEGAWSIVIGVEEVQTGVWPSRDLLLKTTKLS